MRNVWDVQQSVVEKGEMITVLGVLDRNPNGVHMALSSSIVDFKNLHMKFKVGIRLITSFLP